MKAWAVTGLVVVGLAGLAVTAGWWAAPLLAWVRVETDLIQGLADLTQLVLWTLAGIGLVVGLWRARRRTARQAAGTPADAAGSRIVMATAERSVAVGGSLHNSPIATGDRNQVVNAAVQGRPEPPR